MSTGLVYVAVIDRNGTEPQESLSPVVFNNYDEAYKYGELYIKLKSATGFPDQVIVSIWTSGPNQNGYWMYSSGAPLFVSYD